MKKIILLSVICYTLGAITACNSNKSENMLKSAEKGDAKAQLSVALSYLSGDNESKDCNKAIEWLEKSAEQGYDLAQLYLGYCYGT
ncbi:MAG: sel1 repeat family protein, partial [Bacteroidales bacterium]|nr:sel1 repeat family protein [Bacteroidales bacterium]